MSPLPALDPQSLKELAEVTKYLELMVLSLEETVSLISRRISEAFASMGGTEELNRLIKELEELEELEDLE